MRFRVNSARIYSPLDVFTDISFCYFQSNMVSLPEEENTPEKRVNKIFNLMDKVSHVVHLALGDQLKKETQLPERVNFSLYV